MNKSSNVLNKLTLKITFYLILWFQNTVDDCDLLFINICEWERLPEIKEDTDPIPVAGGSVYEYTKTTGILYMLLIENIIICNIGRKFFSKPLPL